MVSAKWNGVLLAESSDTIVLEGNHYFPPNSIKSEYFLESNTTTTCAWKGVAKYYNIFVNGKTNNDAAWFYPAPKEAANNIKGRVAFWKGVEVK